MEVHKVSIFTFLIILCFSISVVVNCRRLPIPDDNKFSRKSNKKFLIRSCFKKTDKSDDQTKDHDNSENNSKGNVINLFNNKNPTSNFEDYENSGNIEGEKPTVTKKKIPIQTHNSNKSKRNINESRDNIEVEKPNISKKNIPHIHQGNVVKRFSSAEDSGNIDGGGLSVNKNIPTQIHQSNNSKRVSSTEDRDNIKSKGPSISRKTNPIQIHESNNSKRVSSTEDSKSKGPSISRKTNPIQIHESNNSNRVIKSRGPSISRKNIPIQIHESNNNNSKRVSSTEDRDNIKNKGSSISRKNIPIQINESTEDSDIIESKSPSTKKKNIPIHQRSNSKRFSNTKSDLSTRKSNRTDPDLNSDNEEHKNSTRGNESSTDDETDDDIIYNRRSTKSTPVNRCDNDLDDRSNARKIVDPISFVNNPDGIDYYNIGTKARKSRKERDSSKSKDLSTTDNRKLVSKTRDRLSSKEIGRSSNSTKIENRSLPKSVSDSAIIDSANKENIVLFDDSHISKTSDLVKLPVKNPKEIYNLSWAVSGFSKNRDHQHLITDGKFGEDAWFSTKWKHFNILGVADGVGGWKKRNIDPGKFSYALMRTCENLVNSGKFDVNSPTNLLDKSMKELNLYQPKLYGGSTACVVIIDKYNGLAYTANLGDSGFLVIRNGEIFHKSKMLIHGFNRPYQLSKAPLWDLRKGDSPYSAVNKKLRLEPDDVIMLATDGVFDNIYLDDLIEMLSQLNGQNDQKKLQQVANDIAIKACANSTDKYFFSPFAKKANQNGRNMTEYVLKIKGKEYRYTLAEVPYCPAIKFNKSNGDYECYLGVYLRNGFNKCFPELKCDFKNMPSIQIGNSYCKAAADQYYALINKHDELVLCTAKRFIKINHESGPHSMASTSLSSPSIL